MSELDELNYDLLEHPLYSPDLAPLDNFLFKTFKQFGLLVGEAISVVKQSFSELPENFLRMENSLSLPK